ncbi:mannosyltransferase [Pseudalgibacter alginicilyticus]|uniref:Mannosyltransferase n=1 Tax=Pseudalgibacter alginicilyticus TaxID=1736674 RepID=A0A0P0CQG5_9FLAO|nr:hypothetical protein [Pseudalgibacter alginicilyticus]ALJ05083.1 mannosyltransferase [Pseudalgibacter alginicilyticus]
MLLNLTLFKTHKKQLLVVIVSLFLYTLFAYYLQRTDYTKLIVIYSALFFLFYKMVQTCKHNIKFLTIVAFLLRATFIAAIPNLSQDFYRFIWDGRMILEGFNPYLYTVESFISHGESPINQVKELYKGMGTLNAGHYTNYPPLNQLCFVIAGIFAGKSILGSAIVFRLIIIAADFGTLYFGKKLLKRLNIPLHNIFWYILNPFIIIELTGNLHFEGVMIFFLIWGLYLLHVNKWQYAAIVLACSISVKLIPLIFLPLFYQWFTLTTSKDQICFKRNEKKLHHQIQKNTFPFKSTLNFTGILKLIIFYTIIIISILLLFSPFYSSQFISNYTKTVGLWFQKFEFNASLYYIAREIGYTFRGWNEIAIIGKTTPIIVIITVLMITFFRRNKTMIQLISAMLLTLSFYYFTATTVHPWYVATLLVLSIFTKYKFPMVWSFVIILSYLAYANSNNQENLWIIGLEYLIVYSVCIWEVLLKKDLLKSN